MGDPKGLDDPNSSPPSYEELCEDTMVAYPDMDASPTKAWMIYHRGETDVAELFEKGFGRFPAEELYDLRVDPHHLRNAAADPAYACTLKELSAQLRNLLHLQRDPRVLEQMKAAADGGLNLAIRWSADGETKNAVAAADGTARLRIRSCLDAAQAAGLWVIEAPLFASKRRLYAGRSDFHDLITSFLSAPLTTFVNAVKDHPALFGYYGPDEPGEGQRADCDAYARAARKLDPGHPLFFLYCGDVPNWPGIYNIAGATGTRVPRRPP
ncbi:MAG: hypothetical protein GW911_29600 [Armatimonadetes bacterium]|nr:hypothetical protein [Armatimonadota bacterium]NDK16202.1 hypothetical protein [Armatimonadota bacterium]